MKELGSAPRRAAARPLQPLLYVEDEDANWEVIEARIGDRFQLFRARSDREAFQILRAGEVPFAGILMDIQLMGSALDGVQITRALKGKTSPEALPEFARGVLRPDLPVVFVTAFGSKHTEASLREAGGTALVHKPVDFAKMSLALARANLELVLQTRVRG